MILRKLATAIREQNWFTVVLEIFIVVVGIFIGLQVDGWNEARKDRAKEQDYLERLGRDIDRDHALLQRSINAADRRAADAVLAMNGYADQAVVQANPCQFLLSAHRVSQNFFPVLYSHTFTEIVSSGHLELLSSDTLKDELSQYYTAHESAEQWMASYRQINLDYARAFAGALTRNQLKILEGYADGEGCAINEDDALAARLRMLERSELAGWYPRLEIRQNSLSERLQQSLTSNERLQKLLVDAT